MKPPKLHTYNNMPLPTTITPPSLCPGPIFPPNHAHFPPRNQFPPGPIFHRPRMATLSGFIAGSQLVGSSGSGGGGDNEARTLIEYVGGGGVDVGDDLVLLIHHLQYACKKIAALVASPFNSTLGKHTSFTAGAGGSAGGTGRDAPKPLDIVSVSLGCFL